MRFNALHNFLPTKGFCQVKTIPKIREKLGSGRVGQAPTRILIFFGNCVFFRVCLYCFNVSIKNEKLDNGVV